MPEVSWQCESGTADYRLPIQEFLNGILSDSENLSVGATKYFYYFILISHILLSIIVVPFVLMAFYFALTDKIEKHRRIVKFTFPIWLYVSVTGVMTYLLISPYY